jgi:hypothetical protein
MGSRRMQIVFLALVAALIVGQGLFGGVRSPTIGEMWERMTAR